MSNKKNILIIDNNIENSIRPIKTLQEQHTITIAGGTKQVENYYNSEPYTGLLCFDIIFVEACMPPGIFSLEETDDGLHTVWPLYNKFLKDLPNVKIIIWTHPIQEYMYPTKRYPERRWGDNVLIRKKSPDDNSLVNIVHECI